MPLAVDAPVLRLDSGRFKGQSYEIRGTLRVGRHPLNEVSLCDLAVSRYHCWLSRRDDQVLVEDLASANGTFVNDERVREPRALRPGDRLRVGDTLFVFAEDERSTILGA